MAAFDPDYVPEEPIPAEWMNPTWGLEQLADRQRGAQRCRGGALRRKGGAQLLQLRGDKGELLRGHGERLVGLGARGAGLGVFCERRQRGSEAL